MMSPGVLVGIQAQAHGPRLIFIFLIFFKGALFKKKTASDSSPAKPNNMSSVSPNFAHHYSVQKIRAACLLPNKPIVKLFQLKNNSSTPHNFHKPFHQLYIPKKKTIQNPKIKPV
jgi:hypothetical protein